jgi:hypothetical protein
MKSIRRRLFDVAAALAASELELPPINSASRACVAHGSPPIMALMSDAFRVATGNAGNAVVGVARPASVGRE